MDNDFCAITLSAMEDRPIRSASKLLLTAGSAVSNTDMRWNEKRTTLEAWGKPPVRIEPVAGAIALRGLEGAKAVSAQPLDGAGAALGAAIELKKAGEEWTLPLKTPPTVWYAIVVKR